MAENKTYELHEAAKNGDIKSLNELISNGADLTERDIKGDTATHLAAMHENITALSILIKAMQEKHYDLNCINNIGKTVLHLAVMCNNPGLISKILAAGANPVKEDNNKKIALHCAVESKKISAAKSLINVMYKYGYDLNTRDCNGYTALHCAIEADAPDLIYMLLEAGADIDIKSLYGDSPLSLTYKSAKAPNSLAMLRTAPSNDVAILKDMVKDCPAEKLFDLIHALNDGGSFAAIGEGAARDILAQANDLSGINPNKVEIKELRHFLYLIKDENAAIGERKLGLQVLKKSDHELAKMIKKEIAFTRENLSSIANLARTCRLYRDKITTGKSDITGNNGSSIENTTISHILLNYFNAYGLLPPGTGMKDIKINAAVNATHKEEIAYKLPKAIGYSVTL